MYINDREKKVGNRLKKQSSYFLCTVLDIMILKFAFSVATYFTKENTSFLNWNFPSRSFLFNRVHIQGLYYKKIRLA